MSWKSGVLFYCLVISTVSGAPQNLKFSRKMNPMYVKAMEAYKKLEHLKTQPELRTITTIGVVNGAMQAKKLLRQDLIAKTKDLLNNLDMKSDSENLKKIKEIEDQIDRDHQAIGVLGKSLDLASKVITPQEYRSDLKTTLKEFQKNRLKPEKIIQETNKTVDVNEKIDELKSKILDHFKNMDDTISSKINTTVHYLERQNRALKTSSDLIKRIDGKSRRRRALSVVNVDQLLRKADNDISLESNEDLPVNDIGSSDGKKPKSEKQEEDSDEFTDIPAPEGGGGGLAGLISSLSGGAEGSDIGALVGALTGVISQIFGPNGLDVEGLIGSGTSLIAGLLSGNRNFGIVLGEYVGTAFEGLSGGGGAVNNGKFVGNFLGTVIASLSADPEEDDGPLRADLFVKNMLQSFFSAKKRMAMMEGDEESEGGEHPSQWTKPAAGGSDVFGFIKQLVSGLVGGISGFIFNASLGSTNGLFDGSGAASAALSSQDDHHHHHH